LIENVALSFPHPATEDQLEAISIDQRLFLSNKSIPYFMCVRVLHQGPLR